MNEAVGERWSIASKIWRSFETNKSFYLAQIRAVIHLKIRGYIFINVPPLQNMASVIISTAQLTKGEGNMEEINFADMSIKELYQGVLYTRDEMGELLGNIAANIYSNPDSLQELKIAELVRLYEFLNNFSHWCVSAETVSMATSWITIRMLELQEELDMDLGLERQTKAQIEFRKKEFREMCGLDNTSASPTK
jgi:hypothetical protein